MEGHFSLQFLCIHSDCLMWIAMQARPSHLPEVSSRPPGSLHACRMLACKQSPSETVLALKVGKVGSSSSKPTSPLVFFLLHHPGAACASCKCFCVLAGCMHFQLLGSQCVKGACDLN
jgi:hypothetical protein